VSRAVLIKYSNQAFQMKAN